MLEPSNFGSPPAKPGVYPREIIENNMRAGRIPDDGFLLLASVPYDEIGVDRARAELKSRFLSQFAAEVIGNEFGALAHKMKKCTAVLDWNSRTLEQVDD